MDYDNYRNFLLTHIRNAKIASGGKVINCRCMECPDSSDPRSAHFYISIPDGTKPSLYYCHKCGCFGIVTHKQLISWGLYDKELAVELGEYNTNISSNSKNKKYFNRQTYQLSNSYTTIDSKSEEKRRYLVGRLGVDLSFDDLRSLKICINLLDLLKENHITHLTRDNNIINDIDREFIGFISIDNAFMNMRRTCKEGLLYPQIDKRYVNYRIFDKIETSQRFYTIPTRVDLSKPERIKLHIAEGPIDILSIYLNLRNREEGIYTSIAGNNYLTNILFFLIDMRLPYIELHLYPDNDKFGTLDRMKKIVNRIPDKSIPVYMHKNTYPGEKDFGVPLNHINESIIQLR